MAWNWEAVSAISEIVGAIAVVVSLIYVSAQIRQNTRAVRGSTLDAITQHQQTELQWSSALASEFEKMMQDPGALTFQESWRLGEWLTAAFGARQNEYRQYRQGLLDREVWESVENIIVFILANEFAQNWWREFGRQHLARDFVAVVETLVKDSKRQTVTEIERALRPRDTAIEK